jgi:hypothetical protein
MSKKSLKLKCLDQQIEIILQSFFINNAEIRPDFAEHLIVISFYS